MQKKLRKMLSLLVAATMVLSLMTIAAFAVEETVIEDAILYTINADNELEYNVVYKAGLAEGVVVSDETAYAINSVDALTKVMGVVDAPAVELSADTGTRTLGKAVTADLTLDADGKVSAVTVTAVSKRPVVGISWKKNTVGSDYQGFAEAFERNGAYAVYLPQVKSAAEAQEVLNKIDGIFMTGGEDWNPSLYDEVQTPHGSSGWNDARDTSDIHYMQQAIELDVPMLCVCRGEQGFNVAMGGGLIQDIPYYLGQKVLTGEIDVDRVTGVLSGTLPGAEEGTKDTGYTYYDENYEKVGKTYDSTAGTYMEGSGCEEGHLRVQVDGIIHSGGIGYHELDEGVEGIGISKDSKWLYDIVGSESIDLIATAHHQSANPDKLGDGLTVVAVSSDGIIEAIEYQDATFALGLQWHPERDALGDTRTMDTDGDGVKDSPVDVDQDLCNALLGALVEYAGVNAAKEAVVADPVVLTLTYPENIVASEVTVNVYKGYPTTSSRTLTQMVEQGMLEPVDVNDNGTFTLSGAGTYSYHISGDGYYNILKLFNVTEDDVTAGAKTIEVVGGKLGTNKGEFGDGYQPTVKPSAAPDTYTMDSRDAMLCIWPDEILENYKVADQGYETPAFDGTDAAHQVTTQEELEAFMADRDASCSYMYGYSAGTTPNYGWDIPMAIFTTTEIPEDATLEEAAALVNANGKTTVWYQTQIHPNEPAAGEAALVIIDRFINDPDTKALLDDINVVIVPRINPDGSYLFSRATYDGFDMNRDHMSLKAAELAQLHTVYRLFMAEVVLDGHGFTFYGAGTDKTTGEGYMSNADDVQTTPATSLNNNAAVTDIALEMAGDAFEDATDAGLRIYHYGTTVNNPIGRAYFGLYDCLSFLIETRGIGAGKTNFERRVFSQETVIMSYIEGTAERADLIKETVAAAREDTVAKGGVYGEEDDLLYLYQTSSGETKTEYTVDRYQFAMDGSVYKITEDVALKLNDTGTRTRTRPTAYVIPADHENIEKILYIMDNQGAEYYLLEAGSSAELEQYYYVGPYTYNKRTIGIEADLREATKVTFANGAYVFPMDQVAADVIAMLVEPDVTDSNGYDGSLYQYGVVTYDETTMNFPLYRYTKDDPRTTLVSNAEENASSGGSSKPAINKDAEASDPSVDVEKTTYTDVPETHWAYEAIEAVSEAGLFNGTSATTFSPEMDTTRGQLMTVLARLAGEKAATIDEGVAWAVAKGVSDGTNPDAKITREQLVTMLYRYTGSPTVSGSLSKYTDAASVSDWAEDAMTWAVTTGVIKGMTDTTLVPGGYATRAQIATIMQRYAGL